LFIDGLQRFLKLAFAIAQHDMNQVLWMFGIENGRQGVHRLSKGALGIPVASSRTLETFQFGRWIHGFCTILDGEELKSAIGRCWECFLQIQGHLDIFD
jgi:hypothetical protein